jgi:exodeoxyribonuclease VII small subunit
MSDGPEPQSPTFEECFGRLQKAIERLEQGNVPLETAIDLFEQSMRLAANCRQILDRAELRLTRLVEEHASTLEGADQT